MHAKSFLPTKSLAQLDRLAQNQRDCLGYIRRMGECCRDEIESYFSWKPATISRIIKPLIDEKVLFSHSRMASEHGRRRAFLYMNPDFVYAIGVEIAFSHMQAALIDLGGRILHRTEQFNHARISPEQTIKRLEGMLHDLGRKGDDQPVLGIGISFAGSLLNPNDASYCFPGTFTWEHFPLANAVAQISDLPVEIHTDNVTGMLAELRFGQALKCKNALYVHMLDGIGLGIVSNGMIHTGSSNLGGEFGHICVQPQGPFCYCGGKGCLEAVASSWAILKQVRDRLKSGVYSRHLGQFDLDQLTAADICQSVIAGDAFAMDVLNTAADSLGTSLANVADLLDPEKIILGGILADEAGHQPIISRMKEAYQGNLHFYRYRRVEPFPSKLGRDSNLIGAAAIVFERVLPAFPSQLPNAFDNRSALERSR